MPEGLYFTGFQWWLLLGGTIIAFLIVTEIGFRLGLRYSVGEEEESETESVTGTVLAAILALLGLLLAFSFNIAEKRFETRKLLVLEEANAISTTYLRAEMLPKDKASRVRQLLETYVNVRLAADEPKRFQYMLERSEEVHDELWQIVQRYASAHPQSIPAGLLTRSLNKLIDLHADRVNVILYHRLPVSIIITLYLVAALSMSVLGFDNGIVGKRAILPSVALVVSFSIVVLLIIDLDRPFQRLFRVSQHALIDIHETMEAADSEGAASNPASPFVDEPEQKGE